MGVLPSLVRIGVVIAVLPVCAWAGPACAKERLSHRSLHPPHSQRTRHEPVYRSRSLTVTRPLGRFANPYVGAEPSAVGEDEDAAYGNVARFNPAPYVTSGLQFPFGLDGVGGFGSDLGFDAGESGAVYQR